MAPSLPSLLIIGLFTNVYLLYRTAASTASPSVLIPARVFFAVSAYRCTFPSRYKGHVVLRDTTFSSILLCRTLATAAEISWMYQLAYVARQYDPSSILIAVLSWAMVGTIAVSQCLVWLAVLADTVGLMYWEEIGWAVAMSLNALVNVLGMPSASEALQGPIRFTLCFSVVYLPYQLGLHIPKLRRDRQLAKRKAVSITWRGVRRAAFHRVPTTEWSAWGGLVGGVWMVGYWLLLPLWPYYLAHALT